MCVDSANCDGNCSECQYDTIKRLRARIAELGRHLTDALDFIESYVEGGNSGVLTIRGTDIRLNVGEARAALAGKQP